MLDNKTKELILQYFDAFSNLYAIISMKRALRIIKNQNPDISLTEDEFCDFIDSFDYSDKYYIIVYDNEIYSDEPCKETDSLKKFLIAEFLYTIDYDAYDEMKESQDGFRFYVPERNELLKYSDEFYYEKTAQQINMKNFLKTELNINEEVADVVVEDWVGMWRVCTANDVDIDSSLNDLRRMSRGKFKDFKNFNQAKKFTALYADMFNHTRLPIFRGLTPIEANEEVSPEVYENY